MEWDDIDYVVCLAVTQGKPEAFPDNLHATCTKCGVAVMYRPYVPAHLPKICTTCMERQLQPEH